VLCCAVQCGVDRVCCAALVYVDPMYCTVLVAHTAIAVVMLCYVMQGTIVEWVAQLGQAVKDGDVVAMVETDKVTVEIKAEMDGVITQQFGAV
jgi:glycine cleavage system H lipoate-binding protein